MPSPLPPSGDTLRRVAELRVAGHAWETVAEAVGVSPETVRKWPQRYPARWRAAHAVAERRLLDDATAEAVLTLRRQLRSEDEKSVREAAHKIVQIRIAVMNARRKSKAARSNTPHPPGYADRLLALVRGMSHEQLADAVAEAGG